MPKSHHRFTSLDTPKIRNALQRIACLVYRRRIEKSVWVEIDEIVRELERVEG